MILVIMLLIIFGVDNLLIMVLKQGRLIMHGVSVLLASFTMVNDQLYVKQPVLVSRPLWRNKAKQTWFQ